MINFFSQQSSMIPDEIIILLQTILRVRFFFIKAEFSHSYQVGTFEICTCVKYDILAYYYCNYHTNGLLVGVGYIGSGQECHLRAKRVVYSKQYTRFEQYFLQRLFFGRI